MSSSVLRYLIPGLLSGGLCVGQLARAETDDEDLNLGDIFELKATTATKSEKTLAETPAIIRVLTRADLDMWGVTSVAEALSHVAGLYGISDGVTSNFGIRGINGGLRASSRIMKVMIDGQPVAFRPDSTAYLGPELIPMQAVDRIECVLGPASALYGANAFLGVVNVITKQMTSPGLHAGGSVALSPSLGAKGGSLELLLGHKTETQSMLFAFSGSRIDRSGLSLPETSPLGKNFEDGTSAKDFAQPQSAFARYHRQWTDQEWELSVNSNHRDAYAEFLDYGTLSHDNHIIENNYYIRNRYRIKANDSLTLQVNHTFAEGEPDRREKLSSNSKESYPERNIGYKSHDVQAEFHYQWGGRGELIGGLDYSQDDQELPTIFTVSTSTGQKTAARGEQGRALFINRGAYLQYSGNPLPQWESLGFTANARTDHNSVYGTNNNYRIGLVERITSTAYAKLLFGTSYKVPSPGQLFAQPLYVGDVTGNSKLKPEAAQTVEAQFSQAFLKRYFGSLSVFYTKIKDRIELIPFGEDQRPENVGLEHSLGFEALMKANLVDQSLTLDVGYQKSDEETEEPFSKALMLPTALYPGLSSRLSWVSKSWELADLGIDLAHVSERRASKSNIIENRLHAYALDSYSLLFLMARHTWKQAASEQSLLVKLDNALDHRFIEPGFGGVDLPGQRRTLKFIYNTQF